MPELNTKSRTFRVEFESLIKVLGENLYANPKSAIRELIQNANDSCVRRSVAEKFVPAINIETQTENHILVVEDNGSGMGKSEVIKYLASIGGGKTREERKKLMASGQSAAKMLIGQFGIGFLSSFIIADRVIVETYSSKQGRAIKWICEGTSEYQIEEGNRNLPGTKVTLFLKSTNYDLLENEALTSTIIRYADFISIPIYVNRSATPVNRMNAPWHVDATEAEYGEYIKHRYGIVPIALEPFSYSDPDLETSGVLFIPPRSSEFKRRLRSIDVFSKRMYVGEDLDILPEWSGFVCGVLDCSTLDLVASRESAISEKPSYRALQNFLADKVTSFIRRLALYEKSTFLEFIRQHDWPVLLGAIRSDFFFDNVKDLIPIPSDMGLITVLKYLEYVPKRLGDTKTIYFVPEDQPLGQQQSSIFRARGIPIFHADNIYREFLTKYCQTDGNLGLRQIASGVVELMEPVQDQYWRKIESRYQEMGIVAKAVRFYPPDLPAMVVRHEDYDKEQLINQIVDGSRSVGDFMSRVGHEKSDAYGLCFNVDNPIFNLLTEYEGDPFALEIALDIIYSSALLGAGIELTIELSRRIANSQIRAIELLLGKQQINQSNQSKPSLISKLRSLGRSQ